MLVTLRVEPVPVVVVRLDQFVERRLVEYWT